MVPALNRAKNSPSLDDQRKDSPHLRTALGALWRAGISNSETHPGAPGMVPSVSGMLAHVARGNPLRTIGNLEGIDFFPDPDRLSRCPPRALGREYE